MILITIHYCKLLVIMITEEMCNLLQSITIIDPRPGYRALEKSDGCKKLV